MSQQENDIISRRRFIEDKAANEKILRSAMMASFRAEEEAKREELPDSAILTAKAVAIASVTARPSGEGKSRD